MKSITPSRIEGQLPAPPSKSMTVRALAAGLLAHGTSRIENVSLCDDGLTAAAIAEELGAAVDRRGETFLVEGVGRKGLAPKHGVLNCGESALSIRMFAPIAALLPGQTVLAASGSLASRPMDMIHTLEQVGASVSTENGRAPIRVSGPIRGGKIDIDASVSSQLLTGLLMALPLCEESSIIRASRLKSGPYVRMTIALLEAFGVRVDHGGGLKEFVIEGGQAYRPTGYTVEGDWSGAAFLLVAGATAGRITVTGLDLTSLQADIAILKALRDAGAAVEATGDRVSVGMGELTPFQFDATACPDLFPPLVALAANCPGKSVIHGAERLAYKESDRASALKSEFGKLGIEIEIAANRMEIHGGRITGGTVEAHNDHRIAMAGAIAALRAQSPVSINGPECVSKSYPGFFLDLERLQVTE